MIGTSGSRSHMSPTPPHWVLAVGGANRKTKIIIVLCTYMTVSICTEIMYLGKNMYLKMYVHTYVGVVYMKYANLLFQIFWYSSPSSVAHAEIQVNLLQVDLWSWS